MTGATFSDAWHRISSARVGLLPTVRVKKHSYREQTWYVLQDTFSQKFFRVTPQAWRFLARLTPRRNVDDIWRAHVREFPDQAPGQEEVAQLLSQLNLANLLYFRHQADSAAIYQRDQTRRQREQRGKLMTFLYVRVPLFDPDAWLDRMRPLIGLLGHPLVVVIWLLVVAMGGVAALGEREALANGAQGLLALDNLPWLYLSLTVLKLCHELGHSFVCKHYGGQVHSFGVMFLIFTPLPFMDASASWRFRSRAQRALVGAAGMIVELFLAAIGAMVWANTGAGLTHSLAFNVMVVGSVSSLLFNGNPLLRFDAYYILADLLDIPNLYQKAGQQWLYYADRALFGSTDARPAALDGWERFWMTAYAPLSYVYRLTVTSGVLLYVLDHWFVLGLAMFVVAVWTLVGIPLLRLFAHLTGPRCQKNRLRAWAVSLTLLAALLGLLGGVPVSHSIRVGGMLEAEKSASVLAGVDGWLTTLEVHSGDTLRAGQVIARLENPELVHDLEVTRQQIAEIAAQRRRALATAPSDVSALASREQSLIARLGELQSLSRQLVVRADRAGRWVAPDLHEKQGGWVPRGGNLGEIVVEGDYRFTAIVTQEDAEALFHVHPDAVEVRLHGQADHLIQARSVTLIPYQRQKLASSALGFMGGGDIAVRPDDQSGKATTEAFFELRADIPAGALRDIVALDGLTGRLRIALPEQPLVDRLRESLRQMAQKRYQL
jgi:putative peptide zinc metalloprotease protein